MFNVNLDQSSLSFVVLLEKVCMSDDPMLSKICSGLEAPISTLVTLSSFKIQLNAISAKCLVHALLASSLKRGSVRALRRKGGFLEETSVGCDAAVSWNTV